MINIGIALIVLFIFYLIRKKMGGGCGCDSMEGFTTNVYRYQQYKTYLPYSVANAKTKPKGKQFNVYQYRDMTEEKLKNSVDSSVYILSKKSTSHRQCKEECSGDNNCNWFHFEAPDKKCYLGTQNSLLGGKYSNMKNVAQW